MHPPYDANNRPINLEKHWTMTVSNKTSPQAYDLIVVGAGMVGAALACGVAESGLRVAVVDSQAPAPFREGEVPHIRVSAISYGSEQILRNLGAWDQIIAQRACPYRRMAVSEDNSQVDSLLPMPAWLREAETVFDAAEIDMPWLGHIVENDIVQGALMARMQQHASLRLFCPVRIVGMQRQPDSHRVQLEDGTLLEAPLLIGADGAQSQVRTYCGIGQYREQYEQQAMVCTVRYRGRQEDITWQRFHPSGPRAFLPLADSAGQHYASLVWYDHSARIDELMALDDEALLRAIYQGFPRRLPSLEAIAARARFPLFKSHAFRYVEAGVALVGDAAHTINPLAGQGVNLGLMDAAVLIDILNHAWFEHQSLADPNLLKTYERKRRLANQAMMSLMDMFYYGFSNDSMPLRIARNLGLSLAQNLQPAKRQVMQYAMGLKGELPRLARAS